MIEADNKKGKTLIVVLAIVIIGAGLGVYRYLSQKPVSPPVTSEPSAIEEKPTDLEPVDESASEPVDSLEANFSKRGSLMTREEGWIFLWDEQGRLALTVKLNFADNSVCYLGGAKKDCGLINMGPESYDIVQVEGNRSDGEVTVIKLEELKMSDL